MISIVIKLPSMRYIVDFNDYRGKMCWKQDWDTKVT